MLRVPLPAPYFHSARAQALASFCRDAGMPVASSTSFTMGMLSHPGRFGGDITRPLRLSSGPPQEMPMPRVLEASRECLAHIPLSSERMRPMVVCTSVVSKRTLSAMEMTPSVSIPKMTAHLVPPMSIPRSCCIISVFYF